jgi:hypothetical protein
MATSSQTAGKGSFTVCGSGLTKITRFVETRNNIAASDNTVDVSHLGTTGTTIVTIPALADPNATGGSPTEYQIDYIASSTGPVFFVGQTASGQTVTAFSLTLAVNDVPRGSVTVSVG